MKKITISNDLEVIVPVSLMRAVSVMLAKYSDLIEDDIMELTEIAELKDELTAKVKPTDPVAASIMQEGTDYIRATIAELEAEEANERE